MSRDINSKYWDEELETMPRAEIEKHQLEDLKEIVKFAYKNAPYYKRSFDAAGVKPEDIKTLEDIRKFPFIDKKTQRDTQGVGSFLGELCAVPEEDVVFISTSSGSTGVPTMSPFTKKDFTCKYSVEIEKNFDNPKTDEEVAQNVSDALKARIGVKPYKVEVHPDGGLNTRSEHKSKRLIDERKLDYNI